VPAQELVFRKLARIYDANMGALEAQRAAIVRRQAESEGDPLLRQQLLASLQANQASRRAAPRACAAAGPASICVRRACGAGATRADGTLGWHL
jgi:hypothetical protein